MSASTLVRRLEDLPEDRSICGFRKQMIAREDGAPNSFSYLRISDATPHYHKKTTEFYYVLEGTGILELDGEEVELRKDTVVMIPPGVRHRAYGEVTALVIGNPPFSPDDQFFD